MNKQLDAKVTGKKPYVAPSLTVFGGLRELTLSQDTTPHPSDNAGKGAGGKLLSSLA